MTRNDLVTRWVDEANLVALPRALEMVAPGWLKRMQRAGAELIGPCPACGGHDRFSINTAKRRWNCRGAHGGSTTIGLVMHVAGLDFHTAVERLTGRPDPAGDGSFSHAYGRLFRHARPEPPTEKPAPSDAERTFRAVEQIWSPAAPWPDTLVETYLRGRNLDPSGIPPDDVLRFHPACPFGGEKVPAMVALVRDAVTDEPLGIHRTALTPVGEKATVNGKSRMALGPIAGGVVKLTPDADVSNCLGIAEGIETAMSMRAIPEFGASPIWATICAANLAKFPLLGGIETLWVGVDNDPAGIAAANACCARWYDAGVEAILIRATRAGLDLNDLLRVA